MQWPPIVGYVSVKNWTIFFAWFLPVRGIKWNDGWPTRWTSWSQGYVIGDSHGGQIDVCRLVAMVIWSWTSNMANCSQNVPVGSTPTDTIGPRSCSRLSARYVLVVLKWQKSRSIFKARRVSSFDIVHGDSFLCQPTGKHNREAFACELTHSRLATIIVNVSATLENLPVVWMAYWRPGLIVMPGEGRSSRNSGETKVRTWKGGRLESRWWRPPKTGAMKEHWTPPSLPSVDELGQRLGWQWPMTSLKHSLTCVTQYWKTG